MMLSDGQNGIGADVGEEMTTDGTTRTLSRGVVGASHVVKRTVAGSTINVRTLWAFFVAAAVQRLPFVLLPPQSLVDLKKAFLISSYVLLAWALLRNLHFRSVRVILAGCFLNLAAIVANGGLMPVTPEARSLAGMTELSTAWLGSVTPQGTGILLTVDHTRLWAFTDIIPWNAVGAVFSIGDIVLGVGLLAFFVELMLQKRIAARRPVRG